MHLARFSEFFGTSHEKGGRKEVVIGRQDHENGMCTRQRGLCRCGVAVVSASEAWACSVDGDKPRFVHRGRKDPERNTTYVMNEIVYTARS